MGGGDGGGSGFNIYHMFADSIVFEQLFIFADSRWGGAGGKWIGHFFCGCHKWMTPNPSDWMNLAVKQNPRDDDPGHPRIQKKDSIYVCIYIYI